MIVEGVLPPLLYSSAVSMNFRRESAPISGLSVVLVVAGALAVGVFFMLALLNLGFAFDADVLESLLANPDASQITMEMRGTAPS